MNRRKAIKQTALGLGAMTLGLSNLKELSLPNDKKLGVALVGLGRYSSLQLAPALEVTKQKLNSESAIDCIMNHIIWKQGD